MLKNKKKFLVSMALSLVLMSSSVPALATTIQDTNTNQEVSTESNYNLKDLNEQLVMGVAWMQSSAEYRALCYQAYNTGQMIVNQEASNFKQGDKPLAIITDCDEAVIDNNEFEAGLIGQNAEYTEETWGQWVNHADAKAMPGAKEFLNYAADKGVEIFYVTGRNEKTGLDATMKNLQKLGYPCVDQKHMRLKTTSSNKQPRMDEITKDYNVIIYMGDDAGDFPINSYGKEANDRNQLVDVNKNEFGTHFIILPNPVYGHWESSLSKDYFKLSPSEKDKVRKSYLKTWTPNDVNK
ncbi:5'-nucleotidase, lipoprotein e(P4) family [Clostridium botulinum]|nr:MULTISPECIES: 5'-nucleotidase, lipoprotein e(P4) family [Clostridium]MCS6132899.1 5'-nucleotidase, lipoprotein e(P4) family [Clostridium botulinum]NFE74950.1 5'-nucleotidase, lipoprotein e(P4) family [Clostridium botulinum]NFL46735.1 5'-nucleotidase, lipoprotein e(P4) family [Clostridium botulinum]NFL59722.1 5'-nucleotidase, lipoprotein e(P4) family [Clostridium botulinum]NFL62844.1 5'-nucleotidase, lipoprotein e(P4) family [Clostridium botulinum]